MPIPVIVTRIARISVVPRPIPVILSK